MKKNILFLVLFCVATRVLAQDKVFWKRVLVGSISNRNLATDEKVNEGVYELDVESLRTTLAVNKEKRVEVTKEIISFPNADGKMEKFLIWESSNFDPVLQAQFPNIQSFTGKGITDPNATIYFSTSEKGIQTMVLRSNGQSAEFIEPIKGENQKYILYISDKKTKGQLPLSCTTDEKKLVSNLSAKTRNTKSSDRVFRTMRLALSCTGEYAAYHGGTVQGALAAMNATMTRVNGIFNRDLALKLVIIADNGKVVYTNATTDPYSAVIGGNAPTEWNQELQTTLTNTIGESNYDIGHLFGASGGGGNAGCIGCVCDAGKGSAYTSPSNNTPEGDTFDIDFVAHEFGHQLGATHTFSYDIENTGTSVEPGSGSTIMGYAGITDYNVQSNSDDYFAYASIKQIQDNLQTKFCPVSTTITNSPPIISAGLDYTIPKGTAFILRGLGSDPNGDKITYTWEQNDSAVTADYENSVAVPSKEDGPLFRSLQPGSSSIRFMPSYTNVLSNILTSRWESVPSIERTLRFVLTGRDNAAQGTAQTNSDEAIITVSGSVGPFAVSSQNTENLSWFKGETKTITWEVNGTNNLAGSANVNIKLSTDGGLSFPTTLVANTPNDGSESIIVPDLMAKNCRIWIEPTDNIYYALNKTAFSIGYSASSSCNVYTFSAPFPIPEQSTYSTRTIVVPSTTAIVTDVNFKVNLTHAYFSDVEMEIMSPSGTKVKLFDRNCSSSNGTLDLVYDDAGTDLVCGASTLQTVVPSQPLAAFNGENPSGTWTFRIRDAYATDTGNLNAASIDLCVKSFTLSSPDFEIKDFVVYPNPSKGNFNIQFTSQNSAEVKVEVHDLIGQKIFQKDYQSETFFNKTIELKNVQSGIYLVKVVDGDRSVVKKLVIQ